MILPDFKDFPRMGRLLGIDWGSVRCGVAISDESWEFIFARPQIEYRNESLVERIVKIVSDEKVFGIVIGLPIRSDGAESDTTKKVRVFAAELSKTTNVPIIFVEENLTSFEAEENLKGTKNLKQKLDSMSAKVILENAIAIIKRA